MYIFSNKIDGVEAHVTKHEKGYAVTLKDSDSGEYIPSISVCPTLGQAIVKAKKIVNYEEKEEIWNEDNEYFNDKLYGRND